jgi:amino acid permease
MADVEAKGINNYNEKAAEPTYGHDGEQIDGEVFDNVDFLHRRLGNRQIQLMAIGGSIGTVRSAQLRMSSIDF